MLITTFTTNILCVRKFRIFTVFKLSAPAPVPTDSGEGPSVEHALSMSPTQAQAQAEPRKSLIGAKKQPARKGVSKRFYSRPDKKMIKG